MSRLSIRDSMIVLNQKAKDENRQVLRKAKLMQYHIQMAQIEVNRGQIFQQEAQSPEVDSAMADCTFDFESTSELSHFECLSHP